MILYDVFLSYRREDGEALGEALYNYLTAKGLRVFFDRKKMVDGHYFDTQIRTALKQAPNYVLLATPKVFPFRAGEDWVREEIDEALTLYEREQDNRTFTVLALPDTMFPEKIEKLKYPNRILLNDGVLGDEPKRRLLKAVTQINRRNLWHAAQNWWEESRTAGHRFAGLSIDQAIMPQARPKEQKESRFPIDVYQKNLESATAPVPLLEALKETKGHLYLIGQGGIGKTTALMRIMEMAYQNQAYSETAQIPIFVELSRAPDTDGKLYDGTGSSFIRRAVYQQVRRDRKVKQVTERAVEEVEDVFSIDPETAVDPVNDLFTQKTPAPEYLLLLDGLNEVSRTEVNGHYPVVTRIMQEIQWLMTNCPNVRVILTSRTDEEAAFHESVTRLYLSEIKQETIADYLTRNGRTPEETAVLLEDEKLAETLGVPLFLTLYAALKDTRNVTSRGEIFRTFFHEREEGLGTYTVQSRAAQVEQDVAESASRQSSLRVTAKMQSFMLDFLLPEIAWEMERREVFYLDEFEIEDIITPVLTGTGDTDICGRFGKRLFEKYHDGKSAGAHVKKAAKDLIKLVDNDSEEITELVIDTCLLSLGILQVNNGKYGFMHHHIRDYFAAVRNVNSLRMAVYLREHDGPALDCLKDWQDRPLFPEVRRFVGEMLGEHHNSPVCSNGVWRYNVPIEPCDRNLIERALDLYRGRFSGDDGYALYSLTSILKDVRCDLSGMDLSRLDLTHISFNGVQLGKAAFGANLCGAKISAVNVFPMGHTYGIKGAAFSPNGARIVTFSADKAVIWDVTTGENLCALERYADTTTMPVFSPSGNQIAMAYQDATAVVWDAITGVCLQILNGQKGDICSIEFSPDEKQIVIASSTGTVKIWDINSGKCLRTTTEPIRQETMGEKIYSPYMTYFLTVHRDDISIWDSASGKCVHVLKGREDPVGSIKCYDDLDEFFIKLYDEDTGECVKKVFSKNPIGVKCVSFSPNENQIVVAYCGGIIKFWDTASGECLRTFAVNDDEIDSVLYSPNGNQIMTIYPFGIKIWNVNNCMCLFAISLYHKLVKKAKYSPDGKQIVTATSGAARIWDATQGKCIHSLLGDANTFDFIGLRWTSFVAYSPSGNRIVTAFSNGIAKVWDSASGECLNKLKGNSNGLVSASFSPDGCKLLTASETDIMNINDALVFDPSVKIWDVTTGKCLKVLSRSGDIYSASFSPDGKQIITANLYGTVESFDAETGKCLFVLEKQKTGGISCFTYSPDGTQVATFNLESTGKVKIWDVSFGRCLQVLEVSSTVRSAEFNSNANRIVTASDDGKVIIWNTITGDCIRIIDAHTAGVSYAEYSPDGNSIVTSSHDSTVKIWDAETGKCMDTLSNIPGLIVHGVDFRNLHPDSRFTEEEKELLRRYGAIVDDSDT